MLTRQINGLAKHHTASGYPYNTCLWAGTIAKPTTESRGGPTSRPAICSMVWNGLASSWAMNRSSRSRDQSSVRARPPRADGSLVPSHIGATNWPHAVYFRSLLAEYDATNESAIVAAMVWHCWRAGEFGAEISRRHKRGGDRSVPTRQQVDDSLHATARRTYANFDNTHPKTGLTHLCDDAPIAEHGVTFNETAKLPAILQTKRQASELCWRPA